MCIYLQISYERIGSVNEFKDAKAVVESKQFGSDAGQRHYLVLYGDYAATDHVRPAFKILGGINEASSANSLASSVIAISFVILLTLHLILV